MNKRYERDESFNSLRKKIIGLGERSFRKSHYPTLQEHLGRLERFRSLLDQTRDSILVMEVPSGRVIDANQSATKNLGYSREELLGKTAENLWPEEVLEFLNRAPQEPQEEAEAKLIECLMSTRQGKRFPVEVVLRHAWFDESVYAVAVARDISQRKMLEEQLQESQKMEAIGTLAGGVAHDFNNLLQVILGYADMLLQKKQNEDPDRKGLLAIRRAAKDGGDLVRELLTFSRKAGIASRPINLNDEVKRIQELLSRTIPKMIEIELDLADELKTVSADPRHMEQVLLNLAINARDAMPEGGKLTIETKNAILDAEYCRFNLQVEPGEYVRLAVSDTGHGMDRDTVEHIFEPFYTTKSTGKGTGLGLATVFGIVKSHGGHITCSSEPNMGTTFKIYLPTVASDREKEPETITETIPRGTETVLIVDDEPVILELGQEILRACGYAVLTASNGQDALELYRRKKDEIALVILDLIMPHMGGRECLEQLLKIDPDVRVLVGSGAAFNESTKEAIEHKAAGFISKPYEAKELLRAVRTVLDES
jgi:two-component system cell cycle sensor histidine kinase/response regulator CckA